MESNFRYVQCCSRTHQLSGITILMVHISESETAINTTSIDNLYKILMILPYICNFTSCVVHMVLYTYIHIYYMMLSIMFMLNTSSLLNIYSHLTLNQFDFKTAENVSSP